ncbi:MAG: type IX secretion system membrane protein PorP/SprF [Bacteroidia bacterium]|nr:MAG: type IX secretion system membrane protein PorP/SprF [Bacteroidia bacterium]
MYKMLKFKDMSYIRSIISTVVIFFVFGICEAQQVPMYSQYIMNGFLVNPSYAGRDGYTSVNLTVREQWTGLAQAPSTYALSFQTRILKNSFISKSTAVKRKLVRPTKGGQVGLGGYVFNDNNGIMHRTGAQFAYSYNIPLGGQDDESTRNLAFGLAVTAYQYVINYEGLIYDQNDPYLNNYDRSVFIPDFNFGVSYSTAKYYVGFAMTNLLRGSIRFSDDNTATGTELGHYFLTGGVKLPLSENWLLEPSAFVKSSDMLFKALQLDLSSRLYYKNDYWAGVSWRTNDAIIAMLGLKYDRFYFAYAFDFTLTDIRKQSFGSHEFSLAVKFGASARRYRWLNAY